MSVTVQSRVKSIFGEALDRQGAERKAFLDEACAGDTAIRERVEALLSAVDDDFLGGVTVDPPPSPPPSYLTPSSRVPDAGEAPGTRIGPYRLLQLIGEGGFGAVFMAEQERPVRRRVALKIIKLGMDTRAVVARFEQERQTLALMDHPHIAKVLDAGATEQGRPFFVMELVRGEPITQFCDKNSLTIEERLRLFIQVCQAVQHAHTKGIIHRDIKPNNVLVSMQDGVGGGPLARVIDFGIAKATDHRLTEKTVFTELRQLVGTPEYMSPEQAEGSLDIDTRTDLYALGVILYELLTGVTPFDPKRLRSAAFGELQRIIREVDPPRPSTRLSQLTTTLSGVAAQRRVEPSRLGTVLRGELDWIVMRALEKDRSRRYETASALVADVQRYLAGEAVSAAPPGAAYRVRKFVRRHRGAVLAASLVGAVLVLGVVGTSVGLVQARRERDKAVAAGTLANERLEEAARSNKIASAVTEFFTMDVLDLKPTPPGQPELTVRQVLDRVPEKIQNHFKSEPAVEGVIRERVGQLYLNLGEPRRAAEFLEAAVPLLEKGLAPDHRTTLMAQQRLAELMLEQHQYAKAEDLFDKVYQARVRVLGKTYTFTINSMMRRGLARVFGGKHVEGLRDVEQAAADYVSTFGALSKPALIGKRDLCMALAITGRAEEAERIAREAIADARAHAELEGAEPDFRRQLGSALAAQGRFAEAVAEFDAALGEQIKNYAPTHPKLLDLRVDRARALARLERFDEAGAELRECYVPLAAAYGERSDSCRDIARLLSEIAGRTGDADGAAAWAIKAGQ